MTIHQEFRQDFHHGRSLRPMTREAIRARTKNNDPGKFGQLFDWLPELSVPDEALVDLAKAMKDTAPDDSFGDNPYIPAGFTYLGQFIDHDITLDRTPLAQQQADPRQIENFRSPALDLDSLYGAGPKGNPEFYRLDTVTGNPGPELLIGTAEKSFNIGGPEIPDLPNDLPRDPATGAALIGDERNDENLLVAQTHLAFLKFHNAVVKDLRERRQWTDPDRLFAEAKRIVTWHYQWIVLYDYVERLTEPGLVNKIKARGRQFYRFPVRPFMPAEFSAAVFRLGHAQVRESYSHNRIFREGGAVPGTLRHQFYFSGLSGAIKGSNASNHTAKDFLLPGAIEEQFPPPMNSLPSNWAIDWRRYFDFGTPEGPGFEMNATRLVNPMLTPTLHTLPGQDPSKPEAMLPFRNLKRGVGLGLPSGQDVARTMKVPLLSPSDISQGPDGAAAEAHGLLEATPLWYYILKEAEMVHQGLRLGPVGSILLAETFLGMVHGDHESFLWRRSNWKPELPRENPETFTMVDLLRYVDDINPVG